MLNSTVVLDKEDASSHRLDFFLGDRSDMQPKPDVEYDDSGKSERINRKISFWAALLLATLVSGWYLLETPQDSEEVQKMRLFFKENITQVATFIGLPYDEMEQYAARKKHPFYKAYLKSSTVERENIKTLIHMSYDYTPNQYWFNAIFLWLIFFTCFWFIGLMVEGGIILVRKENEKRKSS